MQTCGSTLPATPNAVAADGAWQQSADTDVQNCSANWQSIYQGCTAGCGQYGYYQYYNYDANSCPGDNAYYSYSGSCSGGNCCQPSYSCGGCNQGTGQRTCTDVACGTGSYQQGCTLVQVTGGMTCSCNEISPNCPGNGGHGASPPCNYTDCRDPWYPWGNPAATSNCSYTGPGCGFAGPNRTTCYGQVWQ